MKIVIPYQKNYSIPQVCCICGAANATIPILVQSKEARGVVSKARISMSFLKCQACLDELKAFNRSAGRMLWPGVFIGGAVGLLVGVGIGLAMSQASGDVITSQNMVNDLLGPLCACGSVPGLLGAVLGGVIGRAIFRHKMGPAARRKLDTLAQPVKLEFSFDESWFGAVKSGVVKLDFSNDAYATQFCDINHGRLASIYCSKCGSEVVETGIILGQMNWAGCACVACKKIYCTKCVPVSFKNLPCPECGKPTENADAGTLVRAGIITISNVL